MKRLLLGLMAAAPSIPVAYAHHSTALVYDRGGALVEAEGVVTEVAWVNPHVRFKMRGAGADGVERLWDIESNSLSIVSRFGLTAELVAAGTRVKVAGNGGRHADNVLWLTNMLLPSGEEILFGAGVRPRWSQETIGSDIRGAVTADTQGLGLFRVWTNATSPPAFWGAPPPLTASAEAARAAYDPLEDEPTENCAPKGMPYIMEQPYPIEIVREGNDILLRMEEYDTVRRIKMSTAAPSGTRATLLGDSYGQWDGETLVVTTTNIGYRWFNGTGIPLGPGATVAERFTLNSDGSRLDYTMTVADLATFTAPVTLRKAWEWRPGEQVRPYECRQ
ncbi:MAG: hypothetical protein EHM50_06095 [Lysobacterales bacterium]|nr:MAG: hypothetical protein EHM50_06095 [Xanthomonadales bacterium]